MSQSTASEHVESRVAEEKLCDECVEDTPATSKCADCNAALCHAHATSHPRSRASYKHAVQQLNSQCVISRIAEHQPVQSCLVHTDKAVQFFCTECNELLCEVCDYAHTSDHKQSLLPIAEAAVKAKATIRAKLGQDASTSPTFLEEKLDAMPTAVDNLQSEVLNTSHKATRYFQSIREAVSEREKEVLAQIDHHQTMRMLPLDKQRGLVATALCVSKTVSAFLDAKQPTGNFLRMSAWLEDAAGQKSTRLKYLTGPPQPTIFNFIPDDDREVRAILKTVGRVSDVTLSLVCPSTSIQVIAKNMEGKCIAFEEADKSQLLVEVTAPNNDVIPQYRLTSSSSSPSLVARYRPMVTGQYKVSATVHGKHLKGSAADVKVHYHLDTFDPAKCPPSLVLSNNNLTVKKTRVHGSACALGTRRYITGQHDINIRLDGVLSNIDAEIGVTSNQ